MYELREETYRNVGIMLGKMKGIVLNLRVLDNGFDSEKVKILAEAIGRSRLTHFNFENMAFRCDYNHFEHQQF